MSDTDASLSKDALIKSITDAWNELHHFIGSLSTEQLTAPTDAAGWTVKDHIIHLATWEKGTVAMMAGESKREVMDIPLEVWEQDDDPINAVIQQRYHDMPLDEVMRTFEEIHSSLLAKLNSMTDADLQRPYKHYFPDSTDEHAMLEWVKFDIVQHFKDHIPWMAAITEEA